MEADLTRPANKNKIEDYIIRGGDVDLDAFTDWCKSSGGKANETRFGRECQFNAQSPADSVEVQRDGTTKVTLSKDLIGSRTHAQPVALGRLEDNRLVLTTGMDGENHSTTVLDVTGYERMKRAGSTQMEVENSIPEVEPRRRGIQ